jgi:acetoin utilization deacetylase AcuC-like enzyme
MKPNNHNVYCTFYDAPEHAFPGHPESPHRLQRMRTWLQNPPYPEMVWLDFEPAHEGEVFLVHQRGLLESLKRASRKGPHEIESSPTYVTEGSYQAALMAAGATLAVSRRILADGCGRGFAIVRPPGHHAEPGRSMGFCLLNNIAIAAADAIASGIGKVAILDFDAHHGNGTQAIFTNTPQVGYLSIHEEKLYPGSGHMNSAPHAYGRIINIPLPAFANQSAFLSIFQEIAQPWLKQFGAEMLFISAGFDTHFSDPLTTTTLETSSFYELSQILIDLADAYCQSRIMFVLEGGYDPLALQDNIQACLAALCKKTTFPDHFGSSPAGRSIVANQIEKLKHLHQFTEE